MLVIPYFQVQPNIPHILPDYSPNISLIHILYQNKGKAKDAGKVTRTAYITTVHIEIILIFFLSGGMKFANIVP